MVSSDLNSNSSSHRTPSICARALHEFIFSELPRRHRTHVHIHVGSTEPRSRENFTFLGHAHLGHLPATSTHCLRRNHTCNFFTSSTQFSFLHASGPQSSVIPNTFLCSPFPLQSQLQSMCSSTQLSCGPQLWPPTTPIVSSHTHRLMMGNTPTASQISEPINITAFAVPSKETSPRQWNSKAPVGRTKFNFASHR